jgi:putative membrane protein
VYGGVNPGGVPRPGRSTRFWLTLGVGIAFIVVLAVLLVLLLDGQFGSVGSGPRPLFGYWGGFFLVFLLIWVTFFVIRVAFWTSRARGGYYGRQGPRRDPAVMVARQRYARGEITREQYDQIMTDLGRRGRGPGGPLSGA